MTNNPFKHWPFGSIAPARKAVTITPADYALSTELRGLYVGTGGNIAIIAADDSAVVILNNVPSGTLITSVSIKSVRATGTTASNLVGFI